jgi:hypothetical protein
MISLPRPQQLSKGFSLAEAVIGIGMATILILTIIALTTAALSGDQKAEMRQIALALADTELNRFAKVVGVVGSSTRSSFWAAPDGVYSGPGTRPVINTNKTKFDLVYGTSTLNDLSTSVPIGQEKDDNRLRKIDLTVTWWNGEQGKPGYGQLSVKSTRLVRESDLRESP